MASPSTGRRNLGPLFEALYGAGVFGEPANVTAAKELQGIKGQQDLALQAKQAEAAQALEAQRQAAATGIRNEGYRANADAAQLFAMMHPEQALPNLSPLNTESYGAALQPFLGALGQQQGFLSSIPTEQNAANRAISLGKTMATPEYQSAQSANDLFKAGNDFQVQVHPEGVVYTGNNQFEGSGREQTVEPTVQRFTDPKTGKTIDIPGQPKVTNKFISPKVSPYGRVTPEDIQKASARPVGYTIPAETPYGPFQGASVLAPPVVPTQSTIPTTSLQEQVRKILGGYMPNAPVKQTPQGGRTVSKEDTSDEALLKTLTDWLSSSKAPGKANTPTSQDFEARKKKIFELISKQYE